MITLHKCGKTLEKLNLYRCDKITADEWLDIAKNFPDEPKLKRLNLGQTHITGEALWIILQKCGKTLKYLDLCYCYNITENEWLYIAGNCPDMLNLKTLELSGTYITNELSDDTRITKEAISIFRKKCSNAKFLL